MPTSKNKFDNIKKYESIADTLTCNMQGSPTKEQLEVVFATHFTRMMSTDPAVQVALRNATKKESLPEGYLTSWFDLYNSHIISKPSEIPPLVNMILHQMKADRERSMRALKKSSLEITKKAFEIIELNKTILNIEEDLANLHHLRDQSDEEQNQSSLPQMIRMLHSQKNYLKAKKDLMSFDIDYDEECYKSTDELAVRSTENWIKYKDTLKDISDLDTTDDAVLNWLIEKIAVLGVSIKPSKKSTLCMD